MDRRDFIRLMAVLSGSAAYSCTAKKGAEKLISKLPPESDVIPGEPVFTHSVCTECPAHCGAIVRSREGLPVKLEGNPAHPINQGTLCLRGQTSLQRLYHLNFTQCNNVKTISNIILPEKDFTVQKGF